MYKIVQNNQVIDIVKNPYFVKFLPSNQVAITDKANAKGIIGSDGKTIYSFMPHKRSDISVVAIEEISVEEFSRLQGLLNSGQEVSADTSALETAKQIVIKRLSNICKNKITAGFSIVLSDGISYGFRLTTEDQLNLMIIESQLNTGVESFVYHATNQPCKIFSKEDMSLIIQAFKKHTLYHTTYFNAVKHYINSLSDIKKVNLFTYGTDISNKVDNITIRQILQNGGEL